ncbi:MAG: GDP-L-fucose synthase [Nitrospirae bacterium]|nr:GDP-L-fucose synthase [Nitrospirota bacterium]
MNESSRIFVAGGTGMVGSAIIRKLISQGFRTICSNYNRKEPADLQDTPVRYVRLDLTRQSDAERFFEEERPEYVFLAAAKVGGILANNTYPAEFIYTNLMIQNNVIHSSFVSGVKKLLFLGSSCIYPKLCPQPMKEEYLLTGPLEPTNEPYAVAKIAGIKMCQSYNRQYGTNYISVMPTNLYGQNDNFDPDTSHVLPGLIRKFHDSKRTSEPVVLWGTGSPLREFLHVDDLAAAVLFLMNHYDRSEIINVGAGVEVSIRDLAGIVGKIVGYEGEIKWDATRPDGMPRKLMDGGRLTALGWSPRIGLEEGIGMVYRWFCGHVPV